MTRTRPWLALALFGACSFQPGALAIDAALDAAELPARCLDAWCKRKQITIHGSEVSGTPDQPMLLVRIESDDDLALAAQDSGDDLRFVAGDGTPLPYQREHFDGATGALLAWVQLPLLEPVDTRIYLYYGNAAASDQQAGALAWASSRYAAVWHLGEASGTTSLADATSNANTAVATNGPTLGTPGVIGTGVLLDGTNDHLRVAASTSLDATSGDATFALWVNWDSLTASHFQRVLVSDHRFTAGDGYEWAAQPGGDFFLYPWGGAETYNLGPSPFTAGTWHYLVATLDFALKEVRVFVDGEAMTFTMENAATEWTEVGTAGDWLWGSNVGLTGPFGGKMDEIQVMRGTRSASWIKTSFANQRPGSTMVTIGPEQALMP